MKLFWNKKANDELGIELAENGSIVCITKKRVTERGKQLK